MIKRTLTENTMDLLQIFNRLIYIYLIRQIDLKIQGQKASIL